MLESTPVMELSIDWQFESRDLIKCCIRILSAINYLYTYSGVSLNPEAGEAVVAK